MPVWLAPRIRRDEGALAEYAKQLAEEEKLEFVGIQRAKVLKKQLVEIDGERFFITGKREMRNATEIAFSQEDTALLDRFVQKKNGRPFVQIQTTSQSDDIFTQILSAKGRSSRLLSLVKIDDIRYRLSDISESERLEYLMRIIALLNGSANMVDLLLVGGSKYSGAMNPSFSKLLTDPSTDFFIIDQSVTGMFERRTRVGF